MSQYHLRPSTSLNAYLLFPAECSLAEAKKIIGEADRILEHRFEVLSKKIKFGKRINWHTDFSGKSWPREPYLEFRANNYDFDSKNYIGDIKLPWELNKHLYLQDLAKAYLATYDEKYTQEFIDQIEDWFKENPYEVGVNWTEGLIASHRVLSWIIALGAFVQSKKINDEFLGKISNSIYQHALFIEKTYEFCGRASNHLLGELCAQIVISTVFPEFEGSKKRLKDATDNLKKELKLQVYRDGVDYEMSLSYQRVILEFLYLPLILEKRKLVKLPREINKTAEKMTEFMMHMIQPNGLLQPVSDADGARVFVLGQDINDFRPHLALAAWLFERADFKYVSEGKTDEIAWFLSKDELSKLNKIIPEAPARTSVAFKEGGYWISRRNWSKDSSWLFFDCGFMGMGKWPPEMPVGLHGHSDILNFGLALGQETFITDNGSYAYTTERSFHLYFRSARAHNTPIVDGQDQNIIEPKPWLVRQVALPQKAKNIFLKDLDYLSGEHTGYSRLKEKIIVRRELIHFENDGFIIIKDTFKGTGSHRITENFHLAPGLKIAKKSHGFVAKSQKRKLQISCFNNFKISASSGRINPVEGWYSPTYGVKEKSTVLKFSFSIKAPQSKYFVLSWGEKISDPEIIFQKTLTKLQLPRVLMLVTNDLSADPRVQKEASSLANSGFEVSALTFITENHHKFYSQDYDINHLEFEPFSPLKNIRHRIGRFLIRIYYNNPRIMKLMNSLGKLKKKLRITTLFMIDYDTNEAIGNKPTIQESKPQRNIITKIFLGLNYFYDLNQKLSQAGIEKKPDVIHAHDLDTLLAGYLIKRKTGAKLIYDSHELWTKQGMPLPGIIIKFMGFLERYLIRKIDAIISVNDSIIESIEKMYNFKFKIPKVVVYNTPMGNPGKILIKDKKQISVLYQGRFAPNRGLEELVLASQYFKKNIKLYFRCTGEKDVEEKIKKIVKDNKIKNIEFLEPVGMHKMASFARFADIGVIPYLPVNENNRLATPNKLFEYAMAGLAIAASDLPEIAKFVKSTENGLLFNPYRPRSIAKTINELAKDPKRLRKMQANSLVAARIYNWENQAKKIENLYQALLNKGKNGQMADN